MPTPFGYKNGYTTWAIILATPMVSGEHLLEAHCATSKRSMVFKRTRLGIRKPKSSCHLAKISIRAIFLLAVGRSILFSVGNFRLVALQSPYIHTAQKRRTAHVTSG